MKPEEQIIVIAEACGWTHVEPKKHIDRHWPWGYLPHDPEGNHPAPVPNYLNDLNAMHDAEKVLNPEQEDLYWDNLLRAHEYVQFWAASATAAQRAEAFLRTLGLWRD